MRGWDNRIASRARHASGAVWLFANNRPSQYIGPIRYCPSEMPPESNAWIDALTGDKAQFVEGCLLAFDSQPKVLVAAE